MDVKDIEKQLFVGVEKDTCMEITEDEYRKMIIDQETETEGLLPPRGELPLKIKESQKYTWFDRTKGLAPIYGIGRHRLSTDGKGITTLVTFHKCLLKCKYCINPQTWQVDEVFKKMNAKELYEEVKKDNLYFQTTGGGITFGGGEPCLHSDFILKFSEICNPKWKLNLETSLNIPQSHLEKLLPVIDYYIIDIKDMNPVIYKQYTETDNKQVIDNLKYLLANGKADQMSVRVPYIPHYNTEKDIEKSVCTLKEMGVKNIERFNYKIPSLFTPDEPGRLIGIPAITGVLLEEE